MGKKASKEHDEALQFYIETAKKLGRRVIDLNDRSPDAIEVYLEDGKILANVIEIMHKSSENLGKLSSMSRIKKESYKELGFDDIKIYQYHPKDKTIKQSLKRIPILDGFSYTCRECSQGFNDVSKFQSHIYHEHTKKNPKNKTHYKEKMIA